MRSLAGELCEVVGDRLNQAGVFASVFQWLQQRREQRSHRGFESGAVLWQRDRQGASQSRRRSATDCRRWRVKRRAQEIGRRPIRKLAVAPTVRSELFPSVISQQIGPWEFLRARRCKSLQDKELVLRII